MYEIKIQDSILKVELEEPLMKHVEDFQKVLANLADSAAKEATDEERTKALTNLSKTKKLIFMELTGMDNEKFKLVKQSDFNKIWADIQTSLLSGGSKDEDFQKLSSST